MKIKTINSLDSLANYKRVSILLGSAGGLAPSFYCKAIVLEEKENDFYLLSESHCPQGLGKRYMAERVGFHNYFELFLTEQAIWKVEEEGPVKYEYYGKYGSETNLAVLEKH